MVENMLQQDFQPPDPKPLLGGRHHLHSHQSGLAVPGCLDRSVQSPVVGWKLDHRMDAALVVEALHRAFGLRQLEPEPETLLHHTDQGSQYRATDYRDLLGKHEIICSMSAKGCCWDNAVVESFFSTMKLELTCMTTGKS